MVASWLSNSTSQGHQTGAVGKGIGHACQSCHHVAHVISHVRHRGSRMVTIRLQRHWNLKPIEHNTGCSEDNAVWDYGLEPGAASPCG